jgi:hypothetical protein
MAHDPTRPITYVSLGRRRHIDAAVRQDLGPVHNLDRAPCAVAARVAELQDDVIVAQLVYVDHPVNRVARLRSSWSGSAHHGIALKPGPPCRNSRRPRTHLDHVAEGARVAIVALKLQGWCPVAARKRQKRDLRGVSGLAWPGFIQYSTVPPWANPTVILYLARRACR